MANWLTLEKFEGIWTDGQTYKFEPGEVIDDTLLPAGIIASLKTYGLAVIAYTATMATAITAFNEQHGDDDYPPSIVPTLDANGDHEEAHILDGALEIDGDQLGIDMTPTHYTPDAGVPEGGDADHLAGHLGGIDNELGTIYARTGAPELFAYDNGGTSTLTATGQDAVIAGDNMLQGQTFASVTLGASLDIIAEEPGTPGNALSVEVVDTGGAGPSTVAYAVGVLTIDLVGLTPDEDAIAVLVNTSGAWDGILRANSGGGAAFGVVAATPLTGGVGSGFTVYAAGEECLPTAEAGGAATSTAALADDVINITTPDLTASGFAAGDVAQITLESNGVRSQSMSLVLA